MVQITKRFPGVVANDGVDFSAQKGEVHALLGENGAGKSTLSSVLAGLYRPDAGEIWVDGQEVQFHSPRHAIDAGIGMVHQHFRLIQSFTVAQNVVLGRESERRSPMVSSAEMVARVDALAERFRLPVRSRARVWQLSVGEQQRVEILKVLYHDADILILDEPTAVLTPQESQSLFATLRHMADGGRTVIFISHKLNEVMDVADAVTVLRKGRNVTRWRRWDVRTPAGCADGGPQHQDELAQAPAHSRRATRHAIRRATVERAERRGHSTISVEPRCPGCLVRRGRRRNLRPRRCRRQWATGAARCHLRSPPPPVRRHRGGRGVSSRGVIRGG